jgi:hypothetical protein
MPTRLGGLRDFKALAQNINIILPIKNLYIGLPIKQKLFTSLWTSDKFKKHIKI